VIPSEYGKLIKTSNQIPPGCDVAGHEDPKGQDREGVHESAAINGRIELASVQNDAVELYSIRRAGKENVLYGTAEKLDQG